MERHERYSLCLPNRCIDVFITNPERQSSNMEWAARRYGKLDYFWRYNDKCIGKLHLEQHVPSVWHDQQLRRHADGSRHDPADLCECAVLCGVSRCGHLLDRLSIERS